MQNGNQKQYSSVEKSSVQKNRKKSSLPGWKELFLFLFIAIVFHGIFFILFRPLVTPRQTEDLKKNFTLVLPMKNPGSAITEYGLKYWLKYTPGQDELKMQQDADFTAKLLQKNSSPLAMEQLLKDLAENSGTMDSFSAPEKKKNMPQNSAAKFLFSSPSKSFLLVQDELFPKETGGKKIQKQKPFPRWQFSTGKTFHGWFSSVENARFLLALHKEKITNSTLYRIHFTAPDLPPAFELIRSCGMPELDILAKRELLAFPAWERPGKEKPSILCTVLWDKELLFAEKRSVIKKEEKEREKEK